MGQQQLLLLVLGIVIVGIAVVAGINVFDQAKDRNDADEGNLIGVSVAADVATWKLKPSLYGGGAQATGIAGVDIVKLGFTQSGTLGSDPAAEQGAWRFAIHDASSTDPYVEVSAFEGGTATTSVHLYIFGPESRCWLPRTGRLVGGSMQWNTGIPSNPGGCAW